MQMNVLRIVVQFNAKHIVLSEIMRQKPLSTGTLPQTPLGAHNFPHKPTISAGEGGGHSALFATPAMLSMSRVGSVEHYHITVKYCTSSNIGTDC